MIESDIHVSDDGDEDYDDQFNEDVADGVYQDWLATVDREDKKTMALTKLL